MGEILVADVRCILLLALIVGVVLSCGESDRSVRPVYGPLVLDSMSGWLIDADELVGVGAVGLGSVLGEPFGVSRLFINGVLFSEWRFYGIRFNSMVRVRLDFDDGVGNVCGARISEIVVVWGKPYVLVIDSVMACGFMAFELSVVQVEDRVVCYIAKTDDYQWVSIKAYRNFEGFWSRVVLKLE